MAFSDTAIYQGGKQVMSLTGDPKTVFNRKRRTAQIGNIKGTCDVTPTVQYDATSSVITIAYNIEEFIASSTCRDTMDISNHTHRFDNAWTDTEEENFRFDIDMSSVVTAAAINQGILPTYELEMIPYTDYLLDLDGVEYTAASFFYPYFSNMDPLHCVFRANATDSSNSNDLGSDKEELFCAIKLAVNYYGMPIFNHMGKSFHEPRPCDCSEKPGALDSWICNSFQFISGFVFYGDVNDLIELLLDKYENHKGEALNTDAFNATFGTLSKNETMRNASDWRTEAFSFCRLSGGKYCSVMSIFTGDAEGIFSVNEDYLQMPWGSCNNTVSISNSSKRELLHTPPNPLSEPYFECKKNAVSTISDEFSAAVGIIIPLRLAMVVFLAFLLFGISKYDEKSYNTHTFKQKQQALDFFANSLLLIRDGKFDASKRYDMETLIRLQQELKQLGDIPKFYEVELPSTNTSAGGSGSNGSSSSSYDSSGRQCSVTGVSKTFRDSIENPLRSGAEM